MYNLDELLYQENSDIDYQTTYNPFYDRNAKTSNHLGESQKEQTDIETAMLFVLSLVRFDLLTSS